MASLEELKTDALAKIEDAVAHDALLVFEERDYSSGGVSMVFKGAAAAASVAAYFNELSNTGPYNAKGVNYHPVARVVSGRLDNGQDDDIAIIHLDARGLAPGELLFADSNDGRSSGPDIRWLHELVDRWPGPGTEILHADLREYYDDGRGGSGLEKFEADMRLIAAQRFIAYAGLTDTGAPRLDSRDSHRSLAEAYRRFFPGLPFDNTLNARLLVQAHEREGRKDLADTVRRFHLPDEQAGGKPRP